jgi:hypothetical protein
MGHCALEYARIGAGVQADVLAQGQWDSISPYRCGMGTVISRPNLLCLRRTVVKTTSMLTCQTPT